MQKCSFLTNLILDLTLRRSVLEKLSKLRLLLRLGGLALVFGTISLYEDRLLSRTMGFNLKWHLGGVSLDVYNLLMLL